MSQEATKNDAEAKAQRGQKPVEHSLLEKDSIAPTPQEAPSKVHIKPKKRFGIISVIVRVLVAIGIIAAAIIYSQGLIENRPDPVERESFERSFTVSVIDADLATFTPKLSAFGEINAAETLNIRAPAAGDVIFVAPNLRAGGILQAGQVLVKVDPFDYELTLDDTKTSLADAQSSLNEAQEHLRIQTLNVDFAARSLDLAQTDLTRAKALFDRGSLTAQQLEARELTLSQRDQSLRQAKSNIILQEATLNRRITAIETAKRNVARAERALAETTITTPYDAIVISSNVVPGATFSQGEAVASVYQANALEVRFTLSEFQYGQLVEDGLIGREVEVIWDIEPKPIVLNGNITRIGAQVDASLGGVELFAALQSSPEDNIRPGTFVSVRLPGISFVDALSIPETAIYAEGNFYTVEDYRMKSIPAEILARDGGNVIVRASVNDGDRIITTRLAQAGDGVLVIIEGEEPIGQGQETDNVQQRRGPSGR